MPRWRQKAVCRGNSGWCVRLPGSPVWKMPAFQTSPAPSANIPPSQPFSLCRSRFFNLLLLLFVLCFFSRTLHSPFRGSPSHFVQKKVLSLFWHLLWSADKEKTSLQIRCFPIFSLFHPTERLIHVESFFTDTFEMIIFDVCVPNQNGGSSRTQTAYAPGAEWNTNTYASFIIGL